MGNDTDDDERLARLRLIRSGGIGPLTYAQLLGKAGSAREALRILPGMIEASGRRGIRIADEREAEGEWRRLKKAGMRLVTLGEPDYPARLAAIDDAPPVLTVKGDPRLLAMEGVAIVGARNASAAGRTLTRTLGEALGKAGYAVVSGMARGIDAAAHEAALPHGTIAVLAGGADSIYPPEHARLYAEIAERGLVVSEQPLGMTARARDFPKRNRIVSGLSRGVVVVEAAERSGTLITARLAAEQGREVFAVPGSPLDPRSRGTNGLLKKGAVLVTDAEDVLDEMASGGQGRLFEPPAADWDPDGLEGPSADDLKANLLDLLSFVPTHRDQLIAETGGATPAVAAALLDLVLDGRIAEEQGGTYVLSAERRGT